ncbi:MAG: hypothetical protein HQM15_05810 [Deltaproteobacteria bacterium]|nr:hypothetical protein [Deltaproteobacteria bacterium]
MTKLKSLLFLFSSFLFLFICSCSFDPIPNPAGGGSSGNGILYVVDNLNDSVYVYDNLSTLSGAVAASRTISGSNTLITSPTVVAVDTSRDYLYVADTTQQKIIVFSPASTSSGNATPLRTYAGLKRAGAFFYDATNDRLYATDLTDQAIKVWDAIRNLSAGSSPTRTIPLGYQPSAFVLDVARDLLYVADPVSVSVKVYENAATLSSSTALTPTRSFTNATNAFVNLNGLALNPDNNILFVSESDYHSIEIFDSASTLSAAVASSRRIVGDATTLTLNQDQVSFNSNLLYVLIDDTHLAIWTDANTTRDNTAPVRSAHFTDASHANSFAYDFTH